MYMYIVSQLAKSLKCPKFNLRASVFSNFPGEHAPDP